VCVCMCVCVCVSACVCVCVCEHIIWLQHLSPVVTWDKMDKPVMSCQMVGGVAHDSAALIPGAYHSFK